ncbi:MAG: tripartite tricarboxylate transporter substrate binding protein [Burkholderiales bacterium]|nr:tripartite tricarboxylate transporter substrate binding protein [Burkholderiales bacterium]
MIAASHATPAAAQKYPERPLRFIVPFPAGVSDTAARTIGQKLGELWGQQVITENRVGAGGTIGTEYAAKSRPDGYTLLMGSSTELAVNPNLYGKLSYSTTRDFAPVALVAYTPLVVLVHPSLPAKSVKELAALAKQRPGEINFASTGNGSTLHFAGEMFMRAAQVRMVHVPHTTIHPLMSVMNGQTELMFGSLPSSIALVKAGKLRALAVTSRKRFAAVPELPTAIEAGYPSMEIVIWNAVMAPAGTPPEILRMLTGEILNILGLPDVKDTFDKLGMELTPGDAGQLGTYLRSELAKFAKVVKETGIRLD